MRVIEPKELIERTGYTRPHTIHCGPDAIYVSALGNADGDGPGGIFMMDCDTFDIIGRLGSRSRAAIPGLRLLVASDARRHDYERVGHAEHDRGRSQPEPLARREIRPSAALLGFTASVARREFRSRRRAANGARAASGPRSRRKPTGLPESSSRSRTCRARSGYGIARTASGTCRKSSRFPPSRPIRRSCPICSKASRPFRRCSATSTSRSTTGTSTHRAGEPAKCASTT